ncbi:MAG: DUF4402 domain-containing protein [Phenylobacterium sp.]
MAYRNLLLAAAGALALSTLATGAYAAGTLNASAVSSVIVVSPTTLTKTQDMNFGTVVRPSGANGNTTFTLDTANNVTKSGGDGSVVASTTTSAKFSLVTTPAIAFSTSAVLSFAPAGLINVAAGTPLITGATGTGPTFNLAANGTAVLTYGGQFDVTPTTTPQTYTGTLAVTVTYN